MAKNKKDYQIIFEKIEKLYLELIKEFKRIDTNSTLVCGCPTRILLDIRLKTPINKPE